MKTDIFMIVMDIQTQVEEILRNVKMLTSDLQHKKEIEKLLSQGIHLQDSSLSVPLQEEARRSKKKR